MKLDLLKDLFNNLNENKSVQNFINELSKLDYKEKEVPIIENILSNNNVTTGSKNSIIWNENDVILKYAKEKRNNEPIYFVKESKKTYWLNNEKKFNNNVYIVVKAQNNKIEEIEINKTYMPKNINVNDVFRIENDEYVIDNLATKELKEEITNMAREIINKQNVNLSQHRKEGHLYMVTEELESSRFLKDLTNPTLAEFEEVDFSKELLNKATEGMVLKYTNGKYEYYSEDGFERTEKM